MDRDAVLIAGGGTGGHIYPGLALADELRRRRPGLPVLFIGNRNGLESRLVPAAGYRLHLVPGGGISGKRWPVRMGHALQVPLGLLKSGWHVIRDRAQVVVGAGGYASGPAVLAGRLLGRATLIMEQNALPGATNRILAPLVDQVAVAFAATAGRLKGRIQVTGNPVRSGLVRLACRRDPAPCLLIFGGSRGARGLNGAIMDILPGLVQARPNLRILHQTGPADLKGVKAVYEASGLAATVVPYIDDMAAAYAAAHLVICRAGATSVAELTAVGRPAILIPLPRSVGGHQ
ncbi:MAG: glycosyltransferase, partial [Acidobacteriota bacterium]